jgi:hypothetical protein
LITSTDLPPGKEKRGPVIAHVADESKAGSRIASVVVYFGISKDLLDRSNIRIFDGDPEDRHRIRDPQSLPPVLQ